MKSQKRTDLGEKKKKSKGRKMKRPLTKGLIKRRSSATFRSG